MRAPVPCTITARHMQAAQSLLDVPCRWQKLQTSKTSFDEEMERTGKLGGMDSAPPAFVGLSVAIVVYLVYLVVSS